MYETCPASLAGALNLKLDRFANANLFSGGIAELNGLPAFYSIISRFHKDTPGQT